MTVNYIRNLKRTMNNSFEDYENGYRQCSEEMWKLIHSLPNIMPDQRERLAMRCRQMWSNRRSMAHHPYQRRPVVHPTSTHSEHYSPSLSSPPTSTSTSTLKILINHSSMSNTNQSCSASSSSSVSSTSISPSNPKLWKPYM